MPTEICLTITDEGTFTVGIEDEMTEGGNEQQFQSLEEAVAAVGQLAQSVMGGAEEATPVQQEQEAMASSYKPMR